MEKVVPHGENEGEKVSEDNSNTALTDEKGRMKRAKRHSINDGWFRYMTAQIGLGADEKNRDYRVPIPADKPIPWYSSSDRRPYIGLELLGDCEHNAEQSSHSL